MRKIETTSTIFGAFGFLVLAITVVYGQVHEMALHKVPALVTEKWTGSDKPYQDIVAQIKKEYSQGRDPDAIAQEYRLAAKLNPTNPVAQFARVCSARGTAVISNSEDREALSLLQILENADPGNIHEYTRYRFCLSDEANTPLPIDDIKTVGEKLLLYDPKDNWARLSLINMLSNYKQGGKEALPYALDWVKQEPENAKAHSSLAQAYFNQWEESTRKNNTLGNQAIQEYQAYLRLAPSNDGFRSHAKRYISHIEEAEANPR